MKKSHRGRIRLAAALSAAALAASLVAAPVPASAQRPPEGACCYTTTVTASSMDEAVTLAITALERMLQTQLEFVSGTRLDRSHYSVTARQA
jgi:hypothetical protein